MLISRVVSWLDLVFPRGDLLLLGCQERWGPLAVGSPLQSLSVMLGWHGPLGLALICGVCASVSAGGSRAGCWNITFVVEKVILPSGGELGQSFLNSGLRGFMS